MLCFSAFILTKVRLKRTMESVFCTMRMFSQFWSGNFSIEDAVRSERPPVIENDQLKQMVGKNSHHTVKEIIGNLNLLRTTFSVHLKTIG